jgi:hypothetical protein
MARLYGQRRIEMALHTKRFNYDLKMNSGREADNSPPFSTQVRNVWRYTSTSPYVFMAWCLIKHQGQLYLLLPTQLKRGNIRTILKLLILPKIGKIHIKVYGDPYVK